MPSILPIILLFVMEIFCSSGFSVETSENNRVLSAKTMLSELKNKNIEIIAPASGVPMETLKRIENVFPFKLHINKNLFGGDTRFHANTDEQRASQLQDALNSDVPNTVIWCLRGGYGVGRLMDVISDMKEPNNKKILIGYSDITALHLFLSQKFGWQTIHGTVLTDMIAANKDLKGLQIVCDLASGEINSSTLPGLIPINGPAKISKSISGKLTGGNLTIIQSSIGTSWQIQTEGKIIFIEDWAEPGYKIDRMLWHLKSAGVFSGAKAILFGDFEAASKDSDVEYALQRFADQSDLPVYKTNNFGHGKYNYPLVYNASAKIEPEGGTFTMHFNVDLK